MRKIYFFCIFFYLSISPVSSQSWDTLRGQVEAPVGIGVMYADSNYLYVAGPFNTIDGMHIQGIGRWNGVVWDSMGAGIDGLTYDSGSYFPENTFAMATYHNLLYVGGVFSSLGNIYTPCTGIWNGTAWDSVRVQPLLTGNDNAVLVMTVINDKLYIGGGFNIIAGFPCWNIACWNDTNWSSLNFPNLTYFSTLNAICEYNGSIYAAGNFADNDDTVANILRWDGTGWHSVDTGVKGSSSWINCMIVYNSELYVAGYFTKSEGNVGNYIQRWNGISWSDVGGGMGGSNGDVWNMNIYNGKLVAMGDFVTAGGVPAKSIAEWNGIEWCGVGANIIGNIQTSAIYKDSLYTGGGCGTVQGSDTINYVAEWTGGNYVDTCGNDATGENTLIIKSEEIMVFPNPNDGQFTLSISNVNEKCSIEIYNVLGETTYGAKVSSGNTEINLSGQPNGVYLYRVIKETGELVGEGKVVIEK
jgi:hypothetical protein